MERTILHCDFNGFYASVECALDETLKNKPLVVAGDPENRRGIILAKNELAKGYGITTAETIESALRKCPGLVIVPPHRKEYLKYSKLANELYLEYTDLVEPFGIDESWLDVTGVRKLKGTGEEIAESIRQAIKERFGLTVSIGVSFNKIFAKLGSDYKKPDAITIISKENFKDIIFPLPVNRLLMVGRKTNETLSRLSIKTIGDLAKTSQEVLVRKLGKSGGDLYKYANGLDDSPVRSFFAPRPVQSIGNGTTFKRNIKTLGDVKIALEALADQVGGRMRKKGLKCNVLALTIKYSDFTTISRQVSLKEPTQLTKEIVEETLNILKLEWDGVRSIRMLTITASKLEAEGELQNIQLSFFDNKERGEQRVKQENLEKTIDEIRAKYGKGAVSKASILDNDLGIGNEE